MEHEVHWTEITEGECRRRLAQADFGRLAVVTDDGPDIFPVNYRAVGDIIVIKTDIGTKLSACLKPSPRVAFEIDQIDSETRSGWSVTVRGRATEVQRLADLLALAEFEPDSWVGERPRWITIRIERISGRAVTQATAG